jgi:hypothetical protein
MTMSEHEKPLTPGEIRTHTIGRTDFTVMHVAGGSFTQARSCDDSGSTILATDRFESVAVRAYADAIEQAESDRIDALDDADDVAFIDSASGELIEPDSVPALADDVAALQLWLNHTAEGEGVEWAIKLLDRIASALSRRATDAQCPGLPLPVDDAVPRCGYSAAHHPHRIGETIRLRTYGDSA